MRRGHRGIGGWRNENPRHFRPRNGGTPHFGPSRSFGLLTPPRFPPPGLRPPRGVPPFGNHPGPNTTVSSSDYQVRNKYRSGNHQNNQQRNEQRNQQYGQRHTFSNYDMRQGEVPQPKHSYSSHDFYNDVNFDDRQVKVPQKSPWESCYWANPTCYEDRSHNNAIGFRRDSEERNKISVPEYTGHRPPSSGNYVDNCGPSIDNSNAFSRSIDDTVDIVRKRLLNLNRESQREPENPPIDHKDAKKNSMEANTSNDSNIQDEQPTKKKVHRLKQNVKSNCDKIKNKIVHQLFMMDKSKIHKLMDNPSSSSKFEYAISSLVTESQNSFNRHLRSVAEKSLCSSSTDFIHNDNNTIYEDTFMKQMQCILDPQDTVILEDIKPMVLAELSKVLQLDDFEQKYEIEEHTAYPPGEDQSHYDQDDYSHETYDYENRMYMPPYIDYGNIGPDHQPDANNLFERRVRKGSDNSQDSIAVLDSQQRRNERRSVENKSCEDTFRAERPLFSRSVLERQQHRKERRSVDNKSCEDKFRSEKPLFSISLESQQQRQDISLDNRSCEDELVSQGTLFHSRTESKQQIKERRLDNKSCKDTFRSEGPLFDTNLERQQQGMERKFLDHKSCEDIRSEIPLFGKRLESQRHKTDRNFDHKLCKDNFESKEPVFELNLESQQQRKLRRSLDYKSCEDEFRSERPLFNTNTEELSDEDDPFAELDQQYHVAVDHNFIANDDFIEPQQPVENIVQNLPIIKKEITDTPQKVSLEIKTFEKIPKYKNNSDKKPNYFKKEIDNQLQDIAESPIKFRSPIKTISIDEEKQNFTKHMDACTKQESTSFEITNNKIVDDAVHQTPEGAMKQEHNSEPEVITAEPEKFETSGRMIKSTTKANNSRKITVDQKPSHRKEKRKKESFQSETNKQILNKNIIINVNDCAAKASEKCDAPKSIFNLFFSKDQTEKESSKESKTMESCDKGYSDKYVKRKDTFKKSKDKVSESKKKHDSLVSSQSIVSPIENNNSSTSGHSPTKTDSKAKLKPIDIFAEHTRISSIHHAHRNTASAPSGNSKTVVENKSLIQTCQKLTRKHTATQVSTKSISRETQTFESKNHTSRFCQTERKKLLMKAVQTDPVIFKSASKSTDAFERMKEIDMEIQALLQEKFRLYSSLESKETCTNTLGMTVLNVAPCEETKENDEDNLSADAIVEDFTNIPVEELEEIAFETMDAEIYTGKRGNKRNRRQRQLKHGRVSLESPSTSTSSKKRKKKANTPIFSLIEQIITDDRPLEDIISLDDYEGPPAKSKKKAPKLQLKLKITKKKEKKREVEPLIKECCVVLNRTDISKYLKLKKEKPPEVLLNESEMLSECNIVEEAVNDIQFDMLDVSEDIVIGDNCEVKSVEDKDVTEAFTLMDDEIILDNSQFSLEDSSRLDQRPSSYECKMYDFSADENLIRDCTAVSGNGDAVLAIECLENAFIAAGLDGNVYHFSNDGQLLNTLRGSNLAVTCLTIVKDKYETTVYTGSLDSRIRYYDLETGLEKGPECNVLSPIQTMDRAWDTVFVGTRTGFVLQFECKNNMLIPVSTVKFSEQSILALRAMKEGPRKVLLVAARSEPVTIKDAQTGLLLRTLDGPKMTVYSLLFEDGKVYCGTSSHHIHVFDYASGNHAWSHEGGKGSVCLRATGGLLFAGCYDGCVYVYREGEARPLAQLRGPSLMLLSLAVVGSKIIVGYKDRSLYIWKIPHSILQEMIL